MPPPSIELPTDMSNQITMYGAEWCGDCRRSKRLLDTMDVAYDYVDLEADVTGADRAHAISGRTNIPVIDLPDGSHLVEPSDAELHARVVALRG
jgi:mycoredoxin